MQQILDPTDEVVRNDSLRVDRAHISLTQKVVEGLRDAVLSGRFQPGQRLVERTLCDMTGVSRTAVREALRSLEAEGLVQNIPNRGPTVAEITLEEAAEIYELRKLLEARAVEIFIKNADQERRDLLKDSVEGMVEASQRNDIAKANIEKRRFYEIILGASGNKLIGQILTQLYGKIAILRNMTMVQESRTKAASDEMRQIYDAISTGDMAAARRACVRHVEKAAVVALDALSARIKA